MPGRAWRANTPASAVVVLGAAVVAVSFAPWYGLSIGGLSDDGNQPQTNAWQVSGLWALAVGLAVAAAGVAVFLGKGRWGWPLVTVLALGGAALVLLPPGGPLCACGAPSEQGFGWFASIGSDEVPEIRFGSHWGRWVAGALLALQFVIAAVQIRQLRKNGTR